MYCKVCGKKLNGTEKFCSDCGTLIDYSDMDVSVEETPAEPVKNENLGFSKSAFHMEGMRWDLEGYPVDEKKTDRVDFDWASVLEGKEKRAAEERRRAIAMSEEDIYERIQSDRHHDEFDWSLVHTMRLDRAGRSELSLFHEDDEELFSTDFIPPLNTADSYESMVQPEENNQTTRGTVVIDRIDKSGIEAAADQAAGIKERDYEALGIKKAPEVQNRRKIEKFYTFNRKNEEFQALLDEEYERIRQKVQAQAEKDAVAAADPTDETAQADAVEEADIEVAPVVEEPVPMTRGEVAKASAEAEADEAERLAEEAERLAEEAAAKAKAAEEAAVKAAAEAQAAEEALKAMEEEEARAAEEAARKAAEEEAARIAAEERAAELAAKEAIDKAEAAEKAAAEAAEKAAAEAAEAAAVAAAAALEATAVEESVEEVAVDAAEVVADEVEAVVEPVVEKTAFDIEAERLAEEEAAIDAELAKLNESHRALEAVAAEIEAGIYEDDTAEVEEQAQDTEERRVNYSDIFDDEEDDDYREKKGGVKTLILDLIIVILLIIVAASCMMIFLPEHSISKRIKSFIPFFKEQAVEQPIEEPIEEPTPEPEPKPEPEPEPEPVISDTAAAILRFIGGANNLGEVTEDQSLLFVSGTDYGLEGIENAMPFENGLWYTADTGETVTYTDAVVRSVMEYYSKLMHKLNEDDTAVMDLVAEDSQLYGELSAISANPEVTHSVNSLRIGEIRSNSSDFYVLVKVAETISTATEPEVTTKLMYMQADQDSRTMKIMNIVDIQ